MLNWTARSCRRILRERQKCAGRARFGFPLAVEQLEQRLELSTLAPWLEIELTTTDLAGNPITTINAGDQFLLKATAQDVRVIPDGIDPQFVEHCSTAPCHGVFATFVDVTYDDSKVSADGPIDHELFDFVVSGDTSVPGIIDEVGGGIFSFTPTGAGELSLFSIPFTAEATGTVEFNLDPADLLPEHASVLYFLDTAVPIERIAFVDATLEVTVAEIAVGIDVKPESSINPINVEARGVIPVVVFGSNELDVTLIDRASLRFAGAAPVHSALEDVDGDGLLDLVTHFRVEDTDLLSVYEELLAADLEDGSLSSIFQTASVSLTGQTIDGRLFAGTDTVQLFSNRSVSS